MSRYPEQVHCALPRLRPAGAGPDGRATARSPGKRWRERPRDSLPGHCCAFASTIRATPPEGGRGTTAASTGLRLRHRFPGDRAVARPSGGAPGPPRRGSPRPCSGNIETAAADGAAYLGYPDRKPLSVALIWTPCLQNQPLPGAGQLRPRRASSPSPRAAGDDDYLRPRPPRGEGPAGAGRPEGCGGGGGESHGALRCAPA